MNNEESIKNIYREHNKLNRGDYFVIMEKERGRFFKKIIGTGKKVLDIGCRDGALTIFFCQGNSVTGFDIDSDALSRAGKIISITTKQVDLNGDWKVDPKSFDVVVAAEVLEHLYYPKKIVEKVARVLTDGGIFTGSVPFAYSVQSKIRYLFNIKTHTPLQDPTHINHFTYKEFRDILKSSFQDVKIISIVSPRFKLLSKIFPFAFARMFLFTAQCPKR